MSIIYKQIAFTGDYSQLSKMGFSFQKLYAGNYMQWFKSETEFSSSVRIWKKGAEVTIDDLKNYEGYFLEALLNMRKEKKNLTLSGNKILYIKNRETKEVFFSKEKIAEFKLESQKLSKIMEKKDDVQITKAIEENVLYADFIDLFTITVLIELFELNWIHVRTLTNN